MTETCQKLDSGTYNKYGNRKRNGRISLLVDTETETIYLVPKEEEHIDFAKRIAEPEHYPKLVPVHVDTEMQDAEPRIVGVITGVCGLEIKLEVRHDAKDLEKAHDIAWKLINISEIHTGKIREDRIVMRYAVRNARSTYMD